MEPVPTVSDRGASQRPLTVLLAVQRTSPSSGALTQALEAAAGLATRGHNAILLTRPDPVVARRCAGLTLPHLSVKLRHALDLASMRALVATIQERGVDVVHAQCGVTLGVALGASGLGARFALVANRASSFRPPRLLALSLRSERVHRVTATCETIASLLVAAGVPREKVRVVHGSADGGRFDPARADPRRLRDALAVPATARLIGQVGVREWKGWKHLLGALPAIRAAVPGAHLLLVGCTSERQRRAMLELVHEVGLADAVSVTGVREDIPEVLAACEVVVDASWAGTGVSGAIREAMAMARPVVATRIAGNGELVEDGATGLLVQPRDAATLAAAITRVLRDHDLAGRLGTAARARVGSEFSVDRRAARLEQVYREALASSSKPPGQS